MKKLIFAIFIIIIFVSQIEISNAQIQVPIDGVTIESSIRNPEPNEDVNIKIESYSVDLDSASMVWSENGKTINHGVGIKSITVKSPAIGMSKVINVIIGLNDGAEIKKAIAIKSGSIDIIWETKGYSPPFYKGKNPLVYENWVKFTAIPHLSLDGKKEINPKNLVYKWKKGGKYIDEVNNSYGVQSIEIKADEIPKPIEISVEVYSRDSKESAEGYMTLNPQEPTISLYEIDPLYGIYYNKTINNSIELKNSEITILSVPYGFSIPFIHNWSINNIEQTNLINNQSITLRTKGDTEGSSNIYLEVKNLTDILQSASASLTVKFKKRNDNSEEITF